MFIRGLLAKVMPGPLPVRLVRGGNEAKVGYRLRVGDHVEDRPAAPYVEVDLDPESMSQTLLHEGGHVMHFVAWKGRPQPPWTPLIHSTYAVTEPTTAITEGYADHFETLWGHFGSDPARRAYYNHLDGHFNSAGVDALFYFPMADVAKISQQWSRYTGVRDGLAAFSGQVYPGDYLRSQYDPARDFKTLRAPNAMIASEGLVASALFWCAVAQATKVGAVAGQGLEQPGVLAAEESLFAAMQKAASVSGPYRPDVLDVMDVVPGGVEPGAGDPTDKCAGQSTACAWRWATASPSCLPTPNCPTPSLR